MYETNEQKIMDSMGPYLMIQKSYGEDDEDDPEIDFSDPDTYFDGDYITLESSFDEFADHWDNCVLELGRNSLLIKDKTDTIEIYYEIEDAEYENLKNIMQRLDSDDGQITFV